MTAGELKKLLIGVADDTQVLTPVTMEFDGAFYSPCSVDSGLCKTGVGPYLDEEAMKEMELLNQHIPEEDAFLLIPCGFGEEKNHRHELN